MSMKALYLTIPLAPLFGAIMAGLFGKYIKRAGAHWVTILGVAVSFVGSVYAFYHVVIVGGADSTFNETIYQWMVSDGIKFQVGFLVDKLTAVMLIVVTFVSLMVHIYTIGYMKDDPGYQRFFSYIALFTFSMLMLVMANNFMQLFFGWEAVGLVSYLLIGFWYKKPTAIFANLKAFLVNRVGDFGFILGIAAILLYVNPASLDYADVFKFAQPGLDANGIAIPSGFQDLTISIFPGVEWSAITVITILLFIGAMGKSAQVPLHVWLPDSMEGPTPISALIHAATMVTAGIFMVARMSPLFELSDVALNFVMTIGAITALFMGFLGLIQTDIKKVVAYSTLSQLGYMTVALGVSAYSAAIFHLMTHAFFKALLFLGAGSVIIAMHHEQDMRKMGGLRKYLPITYITALIGSLALIGFPGFAGFYSKDAIIEATKHSQLAASGFAYFAVVVGVFFTAIYSFRMFFMVFHGKERMDEHTRSHLHETPAVVTGPLILLAIPSVIIGIVAINAMLFGSFDGAIYVDPKHIHGHGLYGEWQGVFSFTLHGMMQLPFLLALAGVGTAYYFTLYRPDMGDLLKQKLKFVVTVLENNYYFDKFNQFFFAGGCRKIGRLFWRVGDARIIDGLVINGSAKTVGWFSGVIRHLQTGYLYHYAIAIILGLLGMLTWLVTR